MHPLLYILRGRNYMTTEISYCPITIRELLEVDVTIMKSYESCIIKGDCTESCLVSIFNEFIFAQHKKNRLVEQYLELAKEFQFCPTKMRSFCKRDRLLNLVFNDLVSKNKEDHYVLEVIFNTYVLEDANMRMIYKELGV